MKGRMVKIAIAVTLILVGGFMLLTRVALPITTESLVNAEIYSLRAPIEGDFELALEPGDTVGLGQAVGMIRNPLLSDERLIEIEAQLTLARKTARLARDRLDAVETDIQELTGRSETYRTARLDQLRAERQEVEADRAAARATLATARKQYDRVKTLADDGYAATAQLDEARRDLRRARADLQAREKQLSAIETEVSSAKDGVYLGDSYNDAPYSEQQIDRLNQDRLRLRADLARNRQEIAALETERQAVAERIRELSEQSLTSPTDGRLWDVAARDGEYVTEGDLLVDVVDCRELSLMAFVSERDFNRLDNDTPAIVRIKSQDREHDGRIALKLGPDRVRRGSFAIVDPNYGESEFRVLVDFSIDDRASEAERTCPVGETAAIVFRPEGSYDLPSWLLDLILGLG